MKKLWLLTAIFFSAQVLAETKPLPAECESFITLAETYFAEVLAEQPEKKAEVEEMRKKLAVVRESWIKIQGVEDHLDEQQREMVRTLRESGEQIFIEQCKIGIEEFKKVTS